MSELVSLSPKYSRSRKKEYAGIVIDRRPFVKYCWRVFHRTKLRSAKSGIPFNLDLDLLDHLMVDQKWQCAISKIPFTAPQKEDGDNHRTMPFGPSIDRITPKLGYVPGNVRFVCNILNNAMGEWGLDNLMILVAALDLQNRLGTIHSPLPPHYDTNPLK